MTSQAASDGWQQRLNNYINTKATPANIDAIRESCPFHLLTHGVIGKMIRHMHYWFVRVWVWCIPGAVHGQHVCICTRVYVASATGANYQWSVVCSLSSQDSPHGHVQKDMVICKELWQNCCHLQWIRVRHRGRKRMELKDLFYLCACSTGQGMTGRTQCQRGASRGACWLPKQVQGQQQWAALGLPPFPLLSTFSCRSIR